MSPQYLKSELFFNNCRQRTTFHLWKLQQTTHCDVRNNLCTHPAGLRLNLLSASPSDKVKNKKNFRFLKFVELMQSTFYFQKQFVKKVKKKPLSIYMVIHKRILFRLNSNLQKPVSLFEQLKCMWLFILLIEQLKFRFSKHLNCFNKFRSWNFALGKFDFLNISWKWLVVIWLCQYFLLI